MFGENPAAAAAHYERGAPVPEVRSNKLDDGAEPIALGASLRHLLESLGYDHKHTSTWVSPAGVKATIGYAGGEYRLKLYEPGYVAGPAHAVVTMTRRDHIRRAVDLMARWDSTYPSRRVA